MDSIPTLVPKLLLQLLEMGSITDAASILGVSQPAASKALRRAEQQIGIELLRRDSRPLLLTTEGKLIAEYARHQQQQEEMLLQHLRLIKKDGAGLIRIASFGASASTHILPKFIHTIGQKQPLIRVEVYEYTDDEALSALREGRVDFAVIVDKEHPDLDIIPVTTDRLVALVHEDDPLSKKSALSVECILNRDFILTKGGSEALIKEWFSSSNVHLKVKHTAVQLTSILALVRAGLGVSIVAELAVPESHPNVSAIPLMPEHPRRICIAKRSGSFSSNAARCAWKHFSSSHI
nr:LysR substrate-binding domain-containing protein [Vibrio crassostreae]